MICRNEKIVKNRKLKIELSKNMSVFALVDRLSYFVTESKKIE